MSGRDESYYSEVLHSLVYYELKNPQSLEKQRLTTFYGALEKQ